MLKTPLTGLATLSTILCMSTASAVPRLVRGRDRRCSHALYNGTMSILYLTGVLSTALLLYSVPAAAILLDPPQVFVDVLFNFSPPDRISTNNFGTASLVDPRFGAVSVTASGTPSPSLVANADIGPNLIPSIFGRGSGILIYGVEIVGPTGPVPVLIDVAGSASGIATSGASFAVESRWDLLDAGSPLAGDDIRSGQLSGSFSQSFDHTVSLMLGANHVYSVFMLADAAAAATLEGSRASADAFVDPIFSFGPGVDPRIYSFNFSDGIGNARPAVVPEPGTIALLSAVLLLLRLLRSLRPAQTQGWSSIGPITEGAHCWLPSAHHLAWGSRLPRRTSSIGRIVRPAPPRRWEWMGAILR